MTSTSLTMYAAALVMLACPAVLLAASSPPAGRHRNPESRLSWPALRVRLAVAASHHLFNRPNWSHTVSFNVPWADSRWNEIAPGLFQGGHYYDELHKFSSVGPVIVRNEFDLVVSLYRDWGHGPADGVEEVRLSIPDGDLTAEELADVTALVPRIVTALGDGRKVLVRCQAGYNRSGLVVALVLLAMGNTADEAIGLIREKRSKHALCNDTFVEYVRTAAAGVTVP